MEFLFLHYTPCYLDDNSVDSDNKMMIEASHLHERKWAKLNHKRGFPFRNAYVDVQVKVGAKVLGLSIVVNLFQWRYAIDFYGTVLGYQWIS